MSSSFKKNKIAPTNIIWLIRIWFLIRSIYRWIRILRPVTAIAGFQYRPANNMIEIDITYLCNLQCNNCNRSSAQAPEAVHISLELINSFIASSKTQNRKWKRIRILGGEPTLHPKFQEIIASLLTLKETSPELIIEVVTNGYGLRVKKQLQSLPQQIWIENSSKSGNIQPHFGAFNLAPQDSLIYRYSDYKNGCAIALDCGMGLTPQGYYPCAIAGGIDRVTGFSNGRKSLPTTDDEMHDLMEYACRLCGRFRDGHFIPSNIRKPIEKQETSVSWNKIYTNWSTRQ